MKKYGELKQNIIAYLSESYNNGTFKEAFQKAVVPLLETKRFKEIYYLYGQIEESAFNGDSEVAELFLNEAIERIKQNSKGLRLNIPAEISECTGERNTIYEAVDTLVFSNSISEIQKRVNAKRTLVNHLTRRKQEETTFEPVNEGILINLLTTQYNNMFGDLQESERKELEKWLNLPQAEVEQRITDLKESVTQKLSNLLTEGEFPDGGKKVNQTLKEVSNLDNTRYSLYKLSKLNIDLS